MQYKIHEQMYVHLLHLTFLLNNNCCLVSGSSISVLSVCQVAGTAGSLCPVLTVTVLLPTAGQEGDQGRTPPDQQRPQNL